MDYAKESLRLHKSGRIKIEVVATVPVEKLKMIFPLPTPRGCTAVSGDPRRCGEEL